MFAPTLAAAVHHLLAFTLIALLTVELSLVRPVMSLADRKRLGRIDGLYGGVALALLLIGVWRASAFEKGMEYYLSSPAFLLKIGAFLLVAGLSLPPTLTFRAWGRRGDALPAPAEIAAVRRWLVAEALVLAIIPLAAAAMARGY